MASRRRAGVLLALALVAGLTGCAEEKPTAVIEQTDAGLRVTFPVGVDRATLPQEAPQGGRLARQGDGSVLVLDAESRLQVAYLSPEPEDLVRLSATGRRVTATLRDDAGTQDANGEQGERTEEVTVTIGEADSVIAEVDWVTRNDGLSSLEVIPTDRGRRWASGAGMDASWREVVDAQPDADTPGMKEQYMCHAQFAPRKDGWYLEPWRPPGTYFETVAARCNRGPESDPEL